MMSSVFRHIPTKVRKALYEGIRIVSAVELALDVVGWGLVPTDIQAKVLIVLATLGFSIAAANTAPKVSQEP